MWKRILLATLAAATIGGGATIAANAATRTPSASVVDVKGPCDEAEHIGDPRCAGVQVPEDRDDDGARREAGEDVRGPCDEAEHANDPRCIGGQVAEDRDDDNAHHEDRSGPSENSGPSGNSGPGSRHDGRSENEGPSGDSGHSGSSGPGSSED